MSGKISRNSEGEITYITCRRVDSPRRGYARLPLRFAHRGAKK